VVASYVAAFSLRFDFLLDSSQLVTLLRTLPVLLAFRLLAFWHYHLFEGLWRYVGVDDAIAIIKAVTVSSLAFAGIVVIFFGHGFPRSVFVIDWVLCGMTMGGARLAIRLFRERTGFELDENRPRGLIVGAGDAGELLLREIEGARSYKIVGFVDDDASKHRARIRGVPVLGNLDALPRLCKLHAVDEILVALPSLSEGERLRILGRCRTAGVPVKTVPGLHELLSLRAGISQLQEVTPEHLLNRRPDQVDQAIERRRLVEALHGRRVLVTGAAGSVGSELCRQLAQLDPGTLLLFEQSESSLYFLELELKREFPDLHCIPVVGDILDRHAVNDVMRAHAPELVFHAAAYKHVPLMEAQPLEAIRNNVFGTEVVARSAMQNGVGRFVLISTDKAVDPVSVMGMTKRVAEDLLLSFGEQRTRFIAVRFGNVLGSQGSVLPLFKWQIASGGPVTVTDPEASRYFMLMSEAAKLVIKAGVIGNGREVMFLDMGEPMRVMDMANDLIRLSGLTPGRDVPVTTVGLRPGERLHEQLVQEREDMVALDDQHMFLVRTRDFDELRFQFELEQLRSLVEARDADGCVAHLRHMSGH
jgi:FlaA1/EpsC-like NDP-sugar epimerase